MPADIDSFDQTEKLSGSDLGITQMSEDEWIELRKVADAMRDMRAEMKAYGSFLPPDDEPDADETDTVAAATPSPRIDTPTYLRERFEYMCTGWHLAKRDGSAIEFTKANRDKIWRLWAAELSAAISARAGGLANPPVGKDADGNPLTFPKAPAVRHPKPLARPVDAGSVQPGAASADRQVHAVVLS